jgi:hypothetical protein
MATKKWLGRSLMALAGVLALAGGALALGSSASADKDWACSDDQLATEEFELASGGGYKTTDDALVDQATILAKDGVADAADLADAAAVAAENDSSRLVIDGRVVADVSFAELSDGTWTIGSVTYCSPPPGDGGSSGPTPSVGDGGEA